MAQADQRQAALPRVAVMGCGGIGGIVAAHLQELGADVCAVTGNQEVAQVLSRRGAVLRDEGQERTVGPIRAFAALPEDEPPFDHVLLCTQPTRVEQAAREAAPFLKPDGRMVCFQNGLCEPRVARVVGEGRVVGAIVAWGGTQLEPGTYDRTAAGGFVLGRLDGGMDGRLEELSRLLECIGPVELTDNLSGGRWSKLAINCAISTLGTLGGDRLGPLMRHRFIRRLALELMTETVQVARAENVKLKKVSGTLDLDWLALSDADRQSAGSPALVAKHTLLLAVGARYRRLRSSMLAALERGRTPQVDFLNGEVVERGRRHNIRTPVSAEAQAMVHRLARRELTPSLQTAYGLFEATGHVRGKDAAWTAAED